MSGAGNFVVATGTSDGIFVRRFNPAGFPRRDALRVSSPSAAEVSDSLPAIAPSTNGNFAVTWLRSTEIESSDEEFEDDAETNEEIFGRVFASDSDSDGGGGGGGGGGASNGVLQLVRRNTRSANRHTRNELFEFFAARLSEVTDGASVGTPNSAFVTIIDNVSSGGGGSLGRFVWLLVFAGLLRRLRSLFQFRYEPERVDFGLNQAADLDRR